MRFIVPTTKYKIRDTNSTSSPRNRHVLLNSFRYQYPRLKTMAGKISIRDMCKDFTSPIRNRFIQEIVLEQGDSTQASLRNGYAFEWVSGIKIPFSELATAVKCWWIEGTLATVVTRTWAWLWSHCSHETIFSSLSSQDFSLHVYKSGWANEREMKKISRRISEGRAVTTFCRKKASQYLL